MNTLGFDDYIEPLKVYLDKYRASVRGGRGSADMSGSSVTSDGDRWEGNAPSSGPMIAPYQGFGGVGSVGGGGGGSGGSGAGGGGGDDMEDDF